MGHGTRSDPAEEPPRCASVATEFTERETGGGPTRRRRSYQRRRAEAPTASSSIPLTQHASRVGANRPGSGVPLRSAPGKSHPRSSTRVQEGVMTRTGASDVRLLEPSRATLYLTLEAVQSSLRRLHEDVENQGMMLVDGMEQARGDSAEIRLHIAQLRAEQNDMNAKLTASEAPEARNLSVPRRRGDSHHRTLAIDGDDGRSLRTRARKGSCDGPCGARTAQRTPAEEQAREHPESPRTLQEQPISVGISTTGELKANLLQSQPRPISPSYDIHIPLAVEKYSHSRRRGVTPDDAAMPQNSGREVEPPWHTDTPSSATFPRRTESGCDATVGRARKEIASHIPGTRVEISSAVGPDPFSLGPRANSIGFVPIVPGKLYRMELDTAPGEDGAPQSPLGRGSCQQWVLYNSTESMLYKVEYRFEALLGPSRAPVLLPVGDAAMQLVYSAAEDAVHQVFTVWVAPGETKPMVEGPLAAGARYTVVVRFRALWERASTQQESSGGEQRRCRSPSLRFSVESTPTATSVIRHRTGSPSLLAMEPVEPCGPAPQRHSPSPRSTKPPESDGAVVPRPTSRSAPRRLMSPAKFDGDSISRSYCAASGAGLSSSTSTRDGPPRLRIPPPGPSPAPNGSHLSLVRLRHGQACGGQRPPLIGSMARDDGNHTNRLPSCDRPSHTHSQLLDFRFGGVEPPLLDASNFLEATEPTEPKVGSERPLPVASEVDSFLSSSVVGVASGPSFDSGVRQPPSSGSPRATASMCHQSGQVYEDLSFPPEIRSIAGVTRQLVPPPPRLSFNVHAGGAWWLLSVSLADVVWVNLMYPSTFGTATRRPPNLCTSVGITSCALRPGLLALASTVERATRGGRDASSAYAAVFAAMCVLAEDPRRVAKMFSPTVPGDEDQGVWSVWLCQNGLWQTISVDTYLPHIPIKSIHVSPEAAHGNAAHAESEPTLQVIRALRSLFATTTSRHGELVAFGCTNGVSDDAWGSAVEKAYAKLCGGYAEAFLSGKHTVADVLEVFTGGPVEHLGGKGRRALATDRDEPAALDATTFAAVLARIETPLAFGAPMVVVHRQHRSLGIRDDSAAVAATWLAPPAQVVAVVDCSDRGDGRALHLALLRVSPAWSTVYGAAISVCGTPTALLAAKYSPRVKEECEAAIKAKRLREVDHCAPDSRGESPSSSILSPLVKLSPADSPVVDGDQASTQPTTLMWCEWDDICVWYTHCFACYDCSTLHDVRLPTSFPHPTSVDSFATSGRLASQWVSASHAVRIRAVATRDTPGNSPSSRGVNSPLTRDGHGRRSGGRSLATRVWCGFHRPRHFTRRVGVVTEYRLRLLRRAAYEAAPAIDEVAVGLCPASQHVTWLQAELFGDGEGAAGNSEVEYNIVAERRRWMVSPGEGGVEDVVLSVLASQTGALRIDGVLAPWTSTEEERPHGAHRWQVDREWLQ